MALAVGAGVGIVGREHVIGQKLVVAQPINNDASAGAFQFRGEVNPTADIVNLLILKGVWVNRKTERRGWAVRILGVFLASLKKWQGAY